MYKTSYRLGALAAFGMAVLLGVSGCGGAGAKAPGDNTPPDTTTPKIGTARFSVNVETGKVTVIPLNGDPASRAIFTGTAAAFQSSDLLNDSGELTRRKLSVMLKNNTGEPIGANGAGFKVLFGDFSNGVASDLRPQTTVSTLAGSGASGSTDGPALAASFSSPHSVLRADDGTIYVNGYNQSLRKIKNGQVSTVATGTGPVVAMCWNSKGNQDNLYAASLNTHKILKINVNTGLVTVIGGTGSAGGDDGPGSTARFNLPYSICDLGTGTAAEPDLIVSEGTTGKIRTLRHNGTEFIVSTLPFTIDAPRGMASLGGGRFIICEAFLRKLAIFNTSGILVELGNGGNGSADGDGSNFQMFEPIGVFAPAPLTQGNRTLYFSESSGLIRQLTLREGGNPLLKADWKSATVAGISQAYNFQDGRGDQAKFLGPVMLGFDSSNNILVADSGNQRIRKITPNSGTFPIDIGGTNTGRDKVRLANPTEYVPTDAGPTPYIRENQVVAVREQVQLTPWSLIVPDGVKSFQFTVTIEAETDSAAPPDAVFNPGPTVGPGSSRAIVRTLSGQTIAGYANGSVSSATFSSPTAFAYDAQGVMYVADANNHAIRRITSDGTVTTVAGIPGNTGSANGTGSVASFGLVTGVAVTPSGREVYVVDSSNNTIRRIALTENSDPAQPFNWQVSTIAGVAGPVDYANGTGSVARFNEPWGIALTKGGELVVSEASGLRIRRLQPIGADLSSSASWLVSLVAGNGSAVGPGKNFVNGTGSAARFNELRGIAVADSGEIYVADRGNKMVRCISVAGVVTTLAGAVGGGFGDSDDSTAAKFGFVSDVAVDRTGYVYVTDVTNLVIRRISPAGSVRTVAGLGAAGTADGPGNVAAFSALNALEVTNAGDVVVGDGSRIRLIQRLISSGTS